MPHLSTPLILSLLIAMSASGCASQNAMNLLPDSVKLDVAQDKAAKQGPLSVDAMMAKARKLHPDIDKKTQVAAKVDETETASLPDQSQHVDEPIQTAYAQEKTTASKNQTYSPSELFQQAKLLNEQTQSIDEAPSVDDIKAAAAAHEWRRLIDEQDVEKQAHNSPAAMELNAIPPLVMPINQVEIVPVSFNESQGSLANDDDLKLKLLRFGKRVPLQITIGKIKDAQGFQIMQSALALGKMISQASGGAPTITYDPTLSAGAAEVRYPKTGRQS